MSAKNKKAPTNSSLEYVRLIASVCFLTDLTEILAEPYRLVLPFERPARDFAIWLACQTINISRVEIASYFDISPSVVSSAASQIKSLRASNKKFREYTDNLKSYIMAVKPDPLEFFQLAVSEISTELLKYAPDLDIYPAIEPPSTPTPVLDAEPVLAEIGDTVVESHLDDNVVAEVVTIVIDDSSERSPQDEGPVIVPQEIGEQDDGVASVFETDGGDDIVGAVKVENSEIIVHSAAIDEGYIEEATINAKPVLEDSEAVSGEEEKAPSLLMEPTKRITIRQVQDAACSHYRITREQLLSKKRRREIVRPRQIAIWLVKVLIPARSLPEIGRLFGDRDHSTVIHAIRLINDLRERDGNLKASIDRLRQRIEESDPVHENEIKTTTNINLERPELVSVEPIASMTPVVHESYQCLARVGNTREVVSTDQIIMIARNYFGLSRKHDFVAEVESGIDLRSIAAWLAQRLRVQDTDIVKSFSFSGAEDLRRCIDQVWHEKENPKNDGFAQSLGQMLALLKNPEKRAIWLSLDP